MKSRMSLTSILILLSLVICHPQNAVSEIDAGDDIAFYSECLGDELGSLIPGDPKPFSGPADSPWPMFRGNQRRTGYVDINTSDNPGMLKWKLKLSDNWIHSSPVIGPNGTIYVGSYDEHLYAINPNGTIKWKFLAGSGIVSTPAVDSNDTIYFGAYDFYFYAIYPNGSLKWKKNIGIAVSSPVIDDNGTIIVGTGGVHALYPNGTEKWSFYGERSVKSSPATPYCLLPM